MTPNVPLDRTLLGYISLLSSVDPQYAFDLSKQTDGTYTISNGAFQAIHGDQDGGVNFEYLPSDMNTWSINVITGNMVTISNTATTFLTNAVDVASTTYKYKWNGAAAGPASSFSLLQGTTRTGVSTVLENIKSNVFQSAGQLIVTKTENVKTIAIYNVNGQKVYSSNVNSAQISIPVKSMSKGVYLVKLTDGAVVTKMLK